MNYTIGDVVKKTGLSAHTLRYYEKEGLLPNVKKNDSGVRIYTKDDLGWLSMIECLKQSGLQIKEIAQYIKWYNQGDKTLAFRLEMFKKRKKAVLQEMRNLKKILDKISFKVILYDEALKLGGLEEANKKPGIKRLRKKLFEHPDDFENRP